MSAEFRKLCAADLAEFKALRLYALATSPESFGSNYAREAAYSDDKFVHLMQADEARFILGGFKQGNLVAMMGIMKLDQISAQIWGVFARPEIRGQGIAKSLLKRIIATAHENSKTKYIRLGVTPRSPAAIGLYEKMGFERYEVEAGNDTDCGAIECEILMKISL
ncbi:MAG: GNAT family N-acetyltransferase [Rhizobiales bacterium]|nr:GNAT family N-acetyltransferase [Hyphomicrobiales bacterium]NRB13019.1 GNAT family N-acetyltransferase [Hyphomicrobiales bacterium]